MQKKPGAVHKRGNKWIAQRENQVGGIVGEVFRTRREAIAWLQSHDCDIKVGYRLVQGD